MREAPQDSFNYHAMKIDSRGSCLCLELFTDGRLIDTDLGDRMEPMFCEMLAELLNRRLLRTGQHISIFYLAEMGEREAGAA